MSDTPKTGIKTVLAEEIKEFFKDEPETADAIREIGATIADVGMTVEDACLLADFDPEYLKARMKECPAIEKYFQVKKVAYKSALLGVLHSHVRNSSDAKMATQLLSLNFSDEYDPKVKSNNAKKGKGDKTDHLQNLIKRVRNNAPASPVNSKSESLEERKVSKSVDELSHIIKNE